jgi:hypothetical protein
VRNERPDNSDTEDDSAYEIEVCEAMLCAISDGEDRVALDEAYSIMTDSRQKKKSAQRTFVQARAVVKDIRKSRRFFKPKKANVVDDALVVTKKPFPKRASTPSSSRTRAPSSNSKGMLEKACFRCGSKSHVIADCPKPKPQLPSSNFVEEVATFTTDKDLKGSTTTGECSHFSSSSPPRGGRSRSSSSPLFSGSLPSAETMPAPDSKHALQEELLECKQRVKELERKIELKNELEPLQARQSKIVRELYRDELGSDRSTARGSREEHLQERDRSGGRDRSKRDRSQRRGRSQKKDRSQKRDSSKKRDRSRGREKKDKAYRLSKREDRDEPGPQRGEKKRIKIEAKTRSPSRRPQSPPIAPRSPSDDGPSEERFPKVRQPQPPKGPPPPYPKQNPPDSEIEQESEEEEEEEHEDDPGG